MCLFDTHCHLDLMVQKGIGIDTALQQARKAGVERIIVPGVDANNWNLIQQYAHEHPMVEWAMGIHPWFVSAESRDQLELMKIRLDQGEDCIAIGECGLDFYHGKDEQRLQIEVLTEQLKLAQRYELPVLFHVRKAHQELLQLLKQYPLPKGGVLHGFTGSYELGMQYIKQGLYIGVGGSITYERARKTRDAVARLPLDKLILETDSPDMPLYGYQGEPNQPKFVKNVLSSFILLRNEPEQTITLMIEKSSKLLFKL
ncbi:TatD family hydrolase [Vibrio sp. 404]|uniref:TatD family hydrolase n=1 Tax=Vibrio marinisediminis TaxID=2758441 RepID=A0A7W2FQA3_9VIBR|nr:TatD family hydrolase [Vibrio marinisediminis]MBA5762287.1 TatD family hydrolase [Vibrio marinisediminis]